VRNSILAIAALLVAWHGAVRWRWDLLPDILTVLSTGSFIIFTLLLLACAIVVLGWFHLQLFRQNGRLLARLEAVEAELYIGNRHSRISDLGLPVGSRAPYFALHNHLGGTTSLNDLLAAAKPLLLIFADPDCGPCRKLMNESVRWLMGNSDVTTIAVISRGAPQANRAFRRGVGLRHLLLQRDFEVADAYKCPRTPGAVLIEPDGRIASCVAIGVQSIQALFYKSVGSVSAGVN
jgi:peroxiredoxin